MDLPQSLNTGIFGASPYDDPNYRPTYSGSMMGGGENPYTSLINDYVQSDYFDRSPFENAPNILAQYSMQDPIFGQITGGYNPYRTEGFNDYLKQQYQMVQKTDPLRIKRSPEDIAKRDLIRKAYGTMGFGNQSGKLPGILNPMPQDPGAIQKLLGPDGNPMIPFPGDTSPVAGPKIPDMSLPIAGPGTLPSLPSMPTPPLSPKPEFPGPQFPGFPDPQKVPGQYNQDDLLQGIEGLFKQYMPQSNQPSLPDLGPLGLFDPGMLRENAMKTKPQLHTAEGMLSNPAFSGLQSVGSSNQITPPPPPEAPMTEDTSSSLPGSLGSQGMFTPGRGY